MFQMQTLGFADSEIHRVVLDEELRPFVPTSWCGEDGYFQIHTSSRLDLSLDGAGVRSGKLQRLRGRDEFEVWSAEQTTLLGVPRPAGEVTVFPTSEKGNVFGSIGATYFENWVFAFDPAGPHVAASRRDVAFVESAAIRLDLVGSSGLPVTSDIGFEDARDPYVLSLLATGTSTSYITREAADRLGHRASKKRVAAELSLQGAGTVRVDLDIADTAPTYAVPVADGPIGLVLGIDFLRRFLTVFDFRGGELGLWPYPGAV